MVTAREVLDRAAAELGVEESPAGSNQVKYNTDYYGRAVRGSAYPWCCVFVWWVFHALGADGLVTKTASCTALLNWLKGRGRQVGTGEMASGDLVFYNWSQGPRGSVANHVGIVESVEGRRFTAIEGNTAEGNDGNGGAVMRRTRGTEAVLAVARPDYAAFRERDAAPAAAPQTVAVWAKASWDKAVAQGVLDGSRPTDPASRQELAVVLDRLGLLKGAGEDGA